MPEEQTTDQSTESPEQAPEEEKATTEEQAPEGTAQETSEEEPKDQSVDDDDEPLGEAGLKALRQERQSRKDAQKKAKALQEEVESLKNQTSENSDADKEIASLKADVARLQVALKKGLTEAQAKRLIGNTVEDLEKDADDLLASFSSGQTNPLKKRPAEADDPSPSDVGSSNTDEVVNKVMASRFGGR